MAISMQACAMHDDGEMLECEDNIGLLGYTSWMNTGSIIQICSD